MSREPFYCVYLQILLWSCLLSSLCLCPHIVVAILNMVRDEGVSFWLQELLLASLHWCFQVDTVQGLQCGAISSAVSLLSHPSSLVRGRAATLIYDLTTPYQGKEEACDLPGCVESLVSLLSDQDSFVRAQTAAALMRSAPPCLTVHYQKHILQYIHVCERISSRCFPPLLCIILTLFSPV